MSGVSSTASHAALQYFPSLIWHEQFGCAHFLVLAIELSLGRLASNAKGPGNHLARFVEGWEYGEACRIAGDSRQLLDGQLHFKTSSG
jgi:hypothetical protein